ncbi:hypothetical protein [Sodaliphilus sp.]|uniref:hypothetical protein n=1 Tax=Sodaliphilus sp. TaxID=2815818 RepID=UPI00388D539E
MKKVYMFLFALMSAATMVAQNKVQVKAGPSNAGEFKMDNIENWSGEGANRAALAIKWTGSEYTWVLGYKFDGTDKTGADMVAAIVANNPNFHALAAGTSYGLTVGGFGYDADGDGFTLLDKNGNEMTPSESGMYMISNTNFDDYTAGDSDDYWNSGWMSKGYWSYNLSDDPATKISYASTGCSGRKLTDGCWDMWLFSPFSGGSNTWGDFKAVPAETPTAVDAVDAVKSVASVSYVNLAGQVSTEPFNGVNVVVTTYTDGSKSSVKVIK